MENSRFRKIIVIISYLCVAKQARIWIINFNQTAYSNIPRAKYELYNVTVWCYMAKVEACPGFEPFDADVKAAREAKRLARKTTESFPQKEGGEAVWVLIIFTVSNPIYSRSM